MLSTCQHILKMEIHSPKSIHQCQVASQTLIKARNLSFRGAPMSLHIFRPAIGSSIKHLYNMQGEILDELIHPGKQRLEMCIDCQRFRFIDEFEARLEGEDNDTAPLTMGVASSKLHLDQHTWVLPLHQELANVLPVCAEMSEEFDAERDSLINNGHQQTGQHRIKFQ